MEELRRLREEMGWSQTRLAQESGTDRATINQVEGGRRSPTIATLEALAAAMGVEVADFFPKAQASLWSEKPPERRAEVAAWTSYVSRRASSISARLDNPDDPAFYDTRTAMLFVEETNRECADIIRTVAEHGPGEEAPFDGAPLNGLVAAFEELGFAIGRADERAHIMEAYTPEDITARKRAEKAVREKEEEMERLSVAFTRRAS